MDNSQQFRAHPPPVTAHCFMVFVRIYNRRMLNFRHFALSLRNKFTKSMGSLKQSLRRIPYWAYLLVLLVISVNLVYFYYLNLLPVSGETSELINGHYIISTINKGSPVSRTEIKIGDTLVSCNGYPLAEWFSCYHGQKAGDTLIFGILRNNLVTGTPVIIDSYHPAASGITLSIFFFFILFSISSLYLLVRCPKEKAVKLFFIYIQFLVIASANPTFLPLPEVLPVIANTFFILIAGLYGIVLIHFHLLYPIPARILNRFRYFPAVFYFAGAISSVIMLVIYLRWVYAPSGETDAAFMLAIRYSLFCATSVLLIALIVAIYQFITIKNTLARNQLKLLIIGTFCVFLPMATLTFFYNWVVSIPWPYFVEALSLFGNSILIICILIAIFRYRIWDVEVIIRKVILYIGATLVIMLTYLFMIWLVDRLTIRMTDFTRFLILGISVITFLLLRDRIQQLIDRIFHRETYDSATVVSDFEAKLTGIYQSDELKQRIVQSLDDIFHFKSFGFMLKKYGMTYEPAFVQGTEPLVIGSVNEINPELEERLQKAKVFSPEELHHKPPILKETNGELVVPLISDGLPNGFFICGQKKSERMYSQQDISILSLLARRVTALLHTASLYQKDLDRQLMLERERARISQDMHDDIGAGLTKIAMISEAPVKPGDKVNESGERMARVASSARDMISRLNVIVWALNPKNDNLDSLIAYSRRYFGEYLENIGISFTTDVPDAIPEITLSPDTRRNLFYAMQEAIHNGVKHGACSEILLEVRINHQIMEITITDNGKGFDITKVTSGGNGLYNMKKRAEELGGSFEIQSSPGKGTIIKLIVKI
ncbi:MAG: ATP-binding protein [Lentimicrobium sp.]